MKTRYYLLCSILLLAALLLSALAYPQLPAQIPTHWNASGKADGFGPRQMIFMGPLLMAGAMALFAILPWLSPRRFAIEAFQATYWFIMLVVVGMFAYIDVATLWATQSGSMDAGRAMLGGIAVFMALIGNVMGKVRRNFWIGIRTPWTLASEKVWYATHRLAGKAMVAGALVCLLGVVLGVPVQLCIAALVAGPLLPLVYSLVYYKQLERSGKLEH
ncbi:MAG: DUF1648 domain-containing protein [Pseudomonadota bacterium]